MSQVVRASTWNGRALILDEGGDVWRFTANIDTPTIEKIGRINRMNEMTPEDMTMLMEKHSDVADGK